MVRPLKLRMRPLKLRMRPLKLRMRSLKLQMRPLKLRMRSLVMRVLPVHKLNLFKKEANHVVFNNLFKSHKDANAHGPPGVDKEGCVSAINTERHQIGAVVLGIPAEDAAEEWSVGLSNF